MTKLVTIPPVKNVDADTLKELRARTPVPLSLVIRTGLRMLKEMPADDYLEAINEQAELERLSFKKGGAMPNAGRPPVEKEGKK